VEEVLHLGATEAEIAETLDVGAIMGGTLSMKSVRHAFSVMDEVKKGASR
jgi:alkylhydroperoxidase/carboxymuconolactone decarboxylase family protein YurZ